MVPCILSNDLDAILNVQKSYILCENAIIKNQNYFTLLKSDSCEILEFASLMYSVACMSNGHNHSDIVEVV